MDVLTLQNVSKSFGGNKIIDALSLCVPAGSVYGFIGQNGAGKTTTMKMITGILAVDDGEIYVAGEKVLFGKNRTNRYVGYLPDVPEFYGYMTAYEYLMLCGAITGMPKTDTEKRACDLLDMVGLENNKKRIGGFSRGMKQRLGVAQALLHKPKLLICDEPTSALDPLGRKELLDILISLKGETTVLFSTHILADVEKVCDHIAILSKGKIALCGTLDEIKASHEGEEQGLEDLYLSMIGEGEK
ncbi:MAG: ABC transporter ATP-binding protein [Bacteroides sp.]|nr:ABC transporter ATP-binding protein [Bacteroides sp.]